MYGQTNTAAGRISAPSCCLKPTGVVRMKEQDLDFDNDADVRVLLLVHDTKPPFLDGRFLFTKQKGANDGHRLHCCCCVACTAMLLRPALMRAFLLHHSTPRLCALSRPNAATEGPHLCAKLQVQL